MATAGAARRPRADSRRKPTREVELPLVESKLTPPARRPGTAPRAGLVNRLRAARAVPVVLVTAPRGYGKTTLVAEWAQRDDRAFAWYTLDGVDDPDAFAAHLAEAVSRVRPNRAKDLDVFVSRGRPDETCARLGRLLASSPAPVVVVLDNVDRLRDAESIRLLARLIGELPQGSQLALLSSEEPPLPLARLRAKGQVFELGAADLRFNDRDAAALLQGAGAAVDQADLEALNGRVEGWPVGLFLAAQELASSEAAGDPVRAGAGPMVEYLRREVLVRLPDEELRFLTRVSVLVRLCGPLCDVVADASGSGVLLEQLERSNLFVVPLDPERRWYRIHTVFRDLLLTELERREVGHEPTLRSRGAAWCSVYGDPGLALDYAREAGDVEQLTDLLERSMLPFAGPSGPSRVEGWLGPLDDDALLDRHPALAAIGALAWAMTGRPDAAERWADAAGRSADVSRRSGAKAKSTPSTPWPALLRSLMCPSGPEEMRADAEHALDTLPLESAWRAPALAVLGSAHAMAGSVSNAESILREAADTASSLGATATESVALACHSLLATKRGDWTRADALAEAAVETVRESRLDDCATSLFAFAADARAALRRGDWTKVHANLERADTLLPRLTYAIGAFAVSLRIEFARVRLALGDAEGATRLLDEVDAIFARRPRLGVMREDALQTRACAEAQNGRATGRMSTLTAAELRLLPLLTTHLSFREIAERLYVSRNTVKTQAISVYRKLGVSSRGEAIGRASDLGLVGGRGSAAA